MTGLLEEHSGRRFDPVAALNLPVDLFLSHYAT